MRVEKVLRVQDPTGLTYYLGSLLPEQIQALTFVPCVREVKDVPLVIRTEGGYQREGEAKRMKQIKQHFEGAERAIIPPVLLSSRGGWTFIAEGEANFGSLVVEDLAAIIDGQHRLGGLSLLAQDREVDERIRRRCIPFMLIEFDGDAEEQEQFETVNSKQKGIKTSHLRYIRKHQSFCGGAAEALRDDGDSVFSQRIAISQRADWDLVTFGSAEDMVALTFDSYFKAAIWDPERGDEDIKAMAIEWLQGYWRQVSISFNKFWADIEKLPAPNTKSVRGQGRGKFEYRLLEETGLRAFAALGSRLFNKVYMKEANDISIETMKIYLDKLSQSEKINLILQKISDFNKDQITRINPNLINSGKAGAPHMANILIAELDRINPN